MAQAVIIQDSIGLVSNIKESDYGIATIGSKPYGAVSLSSILPFRVSFSTITIPGYGPNNVAPIGIAVIGFNNYIL